jgi:hypothetical protein
MQCLLMFRIEAEELGVLWIERGRHGVMIPVMSQEAASFAETFFSLNFGARATWVASHPIQIATCLQVRANETRRNRCARRRSIKDRRLELMISSLTSIHTERLSARTDPISPSAVIE